MLIVGTGAKATFLAEKLYQHNKRFAIVGSASERLDTLDFRFQGVAESQPRKLEHHDLWVVTLKAFQNQAKANLLRAVSPPKAILVLENGLSTDEAWKPLTQVVERGLSTYGVRSTRPGFVTGGSAGAITLSADSSFAFELSALGLKVRLERNMDRAVWHKLAVNASLNVVATLWEVPNGGVVRIPEARNSARRAALEVAQVAKAVGVDWGDACPWEMTYGVALATERNLCSTLVDVLADRPTEYSSINGEILRLARFFQIDVPELEELDSRFRAFLSNRILGAVRSVAR